MKNTLIGDSTPPPEKREVKVHSPFGGTIAFDAPCPRQEDVLDMYEHFYSCITEREKGNITDEELGKKLFARW